MGREARLVISQARLFRTGGFIVLSPSMLIKEHHGIKSRLLKCDAAKLLSHGVSSDIKP